MVSRHAAYLRTVDVEAYHQSDLHYRTGAFDHIDLLTDSYRPKVLYLVEMEVTLYRNLTENHLNREGVREVYCYRMKSCRKYLESYLHY